METDNILTGTSVNPTSQPCQHVPTLLTMDMLQRAVSRGIDYGNRGCAVGVSRPEDGEPIDASLARFIAALGLTKWPNGLHRVQSRQSEHLA